MTMMAMPIMPDMITPGIATNAPCVHACLQRGKDQCIEGARLFDPDRD